MQTVYDWLTIAIFAGLIVLFLQRSQGYARDSMWQYLIAAVGCAVANQFGNAAEGTPEAIDNFHSITGLSEATLKGASTLFHALAIVTIVATVAYIVRVLRPFGPAS